jgi:outer membrane lipoprotein carrier protein
MMKRAFSRICHFLNGDKAMIRKIWVCLGLVLLVWPAAGWGQTILLDEVLGKIQAQYETHADFKANFVQESTIKSLGKKQQAEGIVYFKKPGKMNWTYNKPTKQQIISDGKNLWNYRPEDKQVVLARMTQAFQSKTPSTFLAGIGNLKKDFQARFVQDPASGTPYSLELTPLEAQGGLEKLFLLVEPGTFNILQAKIQDAMGNVTQMNFTKIRFNNNLADSLFTFTPPQGVEVFTMPGTAPSGGVEK